MSPEPDAVHVAPPAPTHVHAPLKSAGKASATVAPDASDGPAFDAVIVYVTLPPATAEVTPSVFVTAKSACGSSVSVSVVELLPGAGSVTPPGALTVAVFDKLPDAPASTAALTV